MNADAIQRFLDFWGSYPSDYDDIVHAAERLAAKAAFHTAFEIAYQMGYEQGVSDQLDVHEKNP